MSRPRPAALGLVLLTGWTLGGCAVPAWVPVLGRRPPAERVAPIEEVAPPARPPAPAGDDDGVVDRVVAVVNEDVITLGELQEALVAYRQENRGRVTGSEQELLRLMLTRLIDSRLQLQEATREKIQVEDAEIDEEMAERMKRFGVSSEAELERLVRAQGLTLEAVRKRVREAIRVAKVIRRKVGLRVSVTDQEIERYLADNRDKLEAGLTYQARHLLVLPEGRSDAAWEAARIRAEMLRSRIAEGADFAELARQHSGDASARDGGDLGTLRRGELAQPIERQILALAPGEVSAPYRSDLGVHVFRLESKETLEGEALQRARQQVRDILYRQKYEARLEAWLREIKQRAVIEIRL